MGILKSKINKIVEIIDEKVDSLNCRDIQEHNRVNAAIRKGIQIINDINYSLITLIENEGLEDIVKFRFENSIEYDRDVLKENDSYLGKNNSKINYVYPLEKKDLASNITIRDIKDILKDYEYFISSATYKRDSFLSNSPYDHHLDSIINNVSWKIDVKLNVTGRYVPMFTETPILLKLSHNYEKEKSDQEVRYLIKLYYKDTFNIKEADRYVFIEENNLKRTNSILVEFIQDYLEYKERELCKN